MQGEQTILIGQSLIAENLHNRRPLVAEAIVAANIYPRDGGYALRLFHSFCLLTKTGLSVGMGAGRCNCYRSFVRQVDDNKPSHQEGKEARARAPGLSSQSLPSEVVPPGGDSVVSDKAEEHILKAKKYLLRAERHLSELQGVDGESTSSLRDAIAQVTTSLPEESVEPPEGTSNAEKSAMYLQSYAM